MGRGSAGRGRGQRRQPRLGLIAAALAGAALAGCSSQPSAETGAPSGSVTPSAGKTETHPVSGLAIVALTVTGGGAVHHFRVERADTPQAQAQGLMFRTELGADEGMIFPSDPPQPRSFWMKNTPLPLDIVFIGTDHRILNIAAQATPYSLDRVDSDGPTSGVLELRGGRAAELGIGAGDLVEW